MTLSKTKQKSHRSQSRRPWSLRHKRPLHRRIEDQKLRGVWNKRLTVAQNLTQIDPNIFQERLPTEYAPTIKNVNEGDAKIVARLINKYQNDTERMARDIKINRWQWTAAEIAKKIKFFANGHVSKPIGDVQKARSSMQKTDQE